MKLIQRILSLTLLVSVFLCGGCKATLAPGGAYAPTTTNGVPTLAPDMAFFIADAAYQIAYNTIDAAFTFERNNRTYLWSVSPKIKQTLDGIRPQAVTANNDYLRARAAYVLYPVPANLTTIQAVLAHIQQLMATATSVLPK